MPSHQHFLFCFLSLFFYCFFFYFFFPQLPTLVSMPLSPPTALGGSALPLILQKQATHGTQSMGFLLSLLPFFPQLPTLVSNAFKPIHRAGWVSLTSHSSKTSDPWNAVHGLFTFTFTFTFTFLPPTPNPLPSGKRALRFASPGFLSSTTTFVTLAEKRGSILILTFTNRLFRSACLKTE